MNEQQKKAAEYAEILLAWSRGESVQYWSIEGCWKTLLNNTDEPSWNFGISKYRIAPKPLECYVTFRGNKPIQLTEVSICADNQRIVLMREVTE